MIQLYDTTPCIPSKCAFDTSASFQIVPQILEPQCSIPSILLEYGTVKFENAKILAIASHVQICELNPNDHHSQVGMHQVQMDTAPRRRRPPEAAGTLQDRNAAGHNDT